MHIAQNIKLLSILRNNLFRLPQFWYEKARNLNAILLGVHIKEIKYLNDHKLIPMNFDHAKINTFSVYIRKYYFGEYE